MISLVLKIFDSFRHRKSILWIIMIALTAVMTFFMTRQTYKEDISDFLPLDNKYNKAMKVFQNISGAERIVTIFQYKDSVNPDQDVMVEAIEDFINRMQEDSLTANVEKLVTQVDMEQVTQITDFVYENIPYFLDEQDYNRFDSLLANPQFIAGQLQQDKEMLMFPVAGMFSANVQKDPLNLFTPKLQILQQKQMNVGYETYDGYIFSEDLSRAIIMFDSPHGSSETEKNAVMLSRLEELARLTETQFKDVGIRFAGGPVIAVGNASQIKADSMLSVALAVILIVTLLLFVFRNIKRLLLIVVSIAWGWLFAMGGLALVHNDVSIIVIGISSVIIGIAVNYPLHLIAHLNHTTDVRTALKEIVMPLLVGNITTVGAFLALVPLKSVALRDLGLFSSFLLIGTIVFVLLFLPHLLKSRKKQVKNKFIEKIGNFKFENKRWIVIPIVLLTLVFGYYSLQTAFDPNIRNINFMTDSQKNDMEYFQNLIDDNAGLQKVYVVADDKSADKALESNDRAVNLIDSLQEQGLCSQVISCNDFIGTKQRQAHRLELWKSFKEKYGETIITQVRKAAMQEGFTEDSFNEFFMLFDNEYEPKDLDYFTPLTENVFASNIIKDKQTGDTQVVDVILTEQEKVNTLVDKIESSDGNLTVFDIDGLNSSIASNLSNDFNYIGWACGLIVFFFLWFSFGSFELATLSFLPMACSWIWILGIMAILGINFNVVNVILATFIFGQGDDYTIFMTEGCQYEYAYRKKMLASYKSSIIISALIMFIGIGTLIFAKHPALKSLAQVTIVGMFSVVLMAYTLPPLIYNWLVKSKNSYRLRPVYLAPWLKYVWVYVRFFFRMATDAIVRLFIAAKPKSRRDEIIDHRMRKWMWHDISHLPSVKVRLSDGNNSDEQPQFIIVNDITSFIILYLSARFNKTVFVMNNPNTNWIARKFITKLPYSQIEDENSLNKNQVNKWLKDGFTIVITEESFNNMMKQEDDVNLFEAIEQLKIQLFYSYHSELIIQPHTPCIYKGTVMLYSEKLMLISKEEIQKENTVKQIHSFFIDTQKTAAEDTQHELFFIPFVIDRYRYKGIEITRQVKRNIKNIHSKKSDSSLISLKPLKTLEPLRTLNSLNSSDDNAFVFLNSGWGETALLVALAHPDRTIFAAEDDDEKQTVAKIAAENIVENIKFISIEEANNL